MGGDRVSRGKQGIEDDRLMAVLDEGGDDVRADEARTSGDQYTHGATLGPSGRPGPPPRRSVTAP
ncbi:hypothetical protein GCM10009574_012640 [Streptomyces asiaticus]|uniref:Uncharacterized protein n=2 Tax=Streptomyces rhizosphaericus TaxID=114699 RepID=A0ABN1SLZ6_9ACTN